MNHSLLSINAISKSFGPVRVLGEVTMQVSAGQVIGLLGENGAGKSTLMNVVSGRYAPDSGTMALDGQPFAPTTISDGINAGIRFVHQELSLAGAMSVAENLFLGNYVSGKFGFINRKSMSEHAAQLLAKVGLANINPDTPAGQLRAGEQQLVEIAKAMVSQPRLLILDEPTSSLTPVEAARLFSLVRNLAAAGTSVIFITHRLEEALANCHRIVVLRDGNLVSDDVAASTTRDRLIHHMVGREAIFGYRGRGEIAGASPRLRVRGLTDGSVLHPVDLDVARGEVLGLFGLLGAGRTEFLETLYGYRAVAKGTVEIDGSPVRLGSICHSVEAGMALVPEGRKTRGILPKHTVRRNISLSSLKAMSFAGFVRKDVEAETSASFARDLGIRMASDQQEIPSLSGGNQQKAILARALSSNPKLLLLDEPTHGVDVGAKSDIYDIIRRLAEAGLSLIVASSELPEIMAIADRCAVFSAGELVGNLPRQDMNEKNILNLAFLRLG
jgi:ribose transport system ATP-binding protein